MTRALVTGATGHVGSHLVRALLERGAEVGALVRPQTNLSKLDPRVRVLREVGNFRPDTVFHCAWSGIAREQRNAAAQIHDNVPYALDVFRAAADAGARVWVGLGSQAEYGPTSDVLVETAHARPTEAYGVAKRAVAMLTEKLSRIAGMRFVWIRLLATYGPADDERHLIPMLIRKLQARETPALTAGTQLVDYLFVEDAAEALCVAAENEGVDGVFNLASGHAVRVRELADMVRDVVAPGAALGFGQTDGGPVRDLRADISRFRAATSWSPRTSLRDGLAKTARWYAQGATS
jgi:nucleoside-diphosphate-sugar epimerase